MAIYTFTELLEAVEELGNMVLMDCDENRAPEHLTTIIAYTVDQHRRTLKEADVKRNREAESIAESDEQDYQRWMEQRR